MKPISTKISDSFINARFRSQSGPVVRWVLIGFLLLLSCALSCSSRTAGKGASALYTPLETSQFQERTTAEERSEFLYEMAQYPSERFSVRRQTIGKSVENRPIEALLIQPRHPAGDTATKPLRILLLGAQHGSEISGCEALLAFAAELTTGLERKAPPLTPALNPDRPAMTFLIVPAVNPDGIANKRRVNADGINLSTDYGALRAPESIAVNRLLMDVTPRGVLDIHESAILKKKSLGAEGWLTDFEAQFECANNPNVNKALQDFTFDVMLPELLEKVNARGLHANRYIGEITSTGQLIRHGGLSAHNFRNKAGIMGAASFLLENRLDPSTKTYPTPRNIRVRFRKQLLCIHTFVSVCQAHAGRIISLTENARRSAPTQRVWLKPEYGPLKDQTAIDIALCRRDSNERVMHHFEYHGDIRSGPAFTPPKRYLFLSHTDFFRKWLSRQGIGFTDCPDKYKRPCIAAAVTNQNGQILPLFLEPASKSAIIGRLPFDAAELEIVGDSK